VNLFFQTAVPILPAYFSLEFLREFVSPPSPRLSLVAPGCEAGAELPSPRQDTGLGGPAPRCGRASCPAEPRLKSSAGKGYQIHFVATAPQRQGAPSHSTLPAAPVQPAESVGNRDPLQSIPGAC